MIIDNTYFVGKIFVPQATSPGETVGDAVLLDNVMNQSYVEVLNLLFGKEMAEEFIDNEDATEGKWKELIDGNDDYKGMRDADNKTSLIADFVYCQFLDEKQSQLTSIGMERPKGQVSTSVSSVSKYVSVWNAFLVEVETLYLYLSENMDLFPDWEAIYFEYKNRLGI